MLELELEEEIEEPPGQRHPPAPWEQIPLEQWNDWRWQLAHRLSSPEELAQVIRLTSDEVRALSSPGHFRVGITPYFATLIDPEDPCCPIRRQVVPTAQELVTREGDMADSLAEDAHSPVPGLVHRYPDRVLMLVTTQCASYCRFCTRSRMVGNAHAQFGRADYARQLAYIAAHSEVRDVLLSGGDPLLLPDRVLEELLRSLRAIPHVEVVRIGTRVPVFLPQRITEPLLGTLRRFHPLWMNVHVNHPRELAPEVEAALGRLADAGIPLGSQTVLLAGINDCPNVIKALVQRLVRNRVRPYYLYQCDLVRGAGHFRTPVAKGIEIMEALRGHTSGFAIPTYTIDVPEGGGKVPILPNYLVSMSDMRVVLRNYEGFLSTYTQPAAGEYRPHDPAHCPYCQNQRNAQGVAGLLAGSERTIAPEGWQERHRRTAEALTIPTLAERR
ncbi:MAG: KamA family radical SAM protein [Chloroflexia bacterium]